MKSNWEAFVHKISHKIGLNIMQDGYEHSWVKKMKFEDHKIEQLNFWIGNLDNVIRGMLAPQL